MSTALSIDGLADVASRIDLVVQVFLVDNLSANALAFRVAAAAVPRALHWKQRCDVHSCQLIIVRPLDGCDLYNAMFCLNRLLKPQDVRERLQTHIVKLQPKMY